MILLLLPTRPCACVSACNNNIVYTVVFVVGIVIGIYNTLYVYLCMLLLLFTVRGRGQKTENFSGLFFFHYTTLCIVRFVRAAYRYMYYLLYFIT